MRQWWGWESSTLVVCDIDLRVGGGWRYVTREADGTEHGWHGTYLEIDRPWRLVSTVDRQLCTLTLNRNGPFGDEHVPGT